MEQTIDGVQYESEIYSGCRKCVAYSNSDLCNKLYGGSGNDCKMIIWIKSEDSANVHEDAHEDELKVVPAFTPSQTKYLQQVFQIDVTQEVLPVKDGFVKKGDTIWWRYQYGPENVKADEHWDNIKGYPDVYSIKEPKYKIVYED